MYELNTAREQRHTIHYIQETQNHHSTTVRTKITQHLNHNQTIVPRWQTRLRQYIAQSIRLTNTTQQWIYCFNIQYNTRKINLNNPHTQWELLRNSTDYGVISNVWNTHTQYSQYLAPLQITQQTTVPNSTTSDARQTISHNILWTFYVFDLNVVLL